MSILCKIFGHQPPIECEHRGGEYMKARPGGVYDGIGRLHRALDGTCPRCGEEYTVGKMHDPCTGGASLGKYKLYCGDCGSSMIAVEVLTCQDEYGNVEITSIMDDGHCCHNCGSINIRCRYNDES